MPEYARAYVEQKGSTDVTYDELCHIAQHQINQLQGLSANEESGLSEKRSINETVYQPQVVFFDTELIVTKVWFQYAFGRVPEWLEEAIQRYKMDVYLLTAPDIPWIPDPARSNGSDAIRRELFNRYEQEIQALGVPYYIITHV